jgi:hypothetical protein
LPCEQRPARRPRSAARRPDQDAEATDLGGGAGVRRTHPGHHPAGQLRDGAEEARRRHRRVQRSGHCPASAEDRWR